MTIRNDDMTDRGRYDLSPFGACDRYSDDCYWRVTFRGAQGNFILGTYDSKVEAQKSFMRIPPPRRFR